MKQSQIFAKTSKDISKEEVSFNAQLLTRAGCIEKLGAGIYTFLPLGLRVLRKIEAVIRKAMDDFGANELLMPALIPQEIWQKTGRWDSLDVLFKLKGHDDKEYGLGATHEEVITPTVQKSLFSYRDLPFATYQIQTKFRNEPRAKSGLLRGREFLMKDLYSFHAEQKDLDDYYDQMLGVYENIYQQLGIGQITYKTHALGGTFSKYSHEFQTVSENGEDIIFICKKCNSAHNRELIEQDGEKCLDCGEGEFYQKKAIEVGNIFKLQDKYSKPFNLTYKNEKGEEKVVIMGCYGIGVSRLMGAIAEVSNDSNGLIWPAKIAPFAVHLVVLGEDDKVWATADKLYSKLLKKGVEVLYDDRKESIGAKLKDSDLIGVPLRVVVSTKSLEKGGFEIKKRDQKEAVISDEKAVFEMIESL